MTNLEYILQAVLLLIAVASIPIALTKRPLSRYIRMGVALCPIVFGLLFYLIADKTGGIFIALMGLWALFFIVVKKKS